MHTPTTGSPEPSLVSSVRPWTALLALFAGLLWWSWGKWLDPLIDFGRELYVPWQITEGRVLYRDIASFNGPLSPYLNALWFRVGGVSLRTLVFANIALAAVLAWFLGALLRRIASDGAAWAAAAAFVVLFSVSHTDAVGNYNVVTPYSHELTHGILLSVLSLWCAARFALDGRNAPLFGAGIAGGLALLTKTEVALALWLGLAALLVGRFRIGSSSPRAAVAGCARLLVGATLPVVAAMLLFALALPIEDAWRAALTPWRLALDRDRMTQLVQLPFYRTVSGTDDWGARIGDLLVWSTAYTAVLGAAAFLPLIRRRGRSAFAPEGIAIVCAASALLLGLSVDDRPARPLPLLLAWLAITSGYAVFVRGRGTPASAVRLGWIVFAGALLFKIALNPRLGHYGFALAMPATLTAVVYLLDWLPRQVGRVEVGRAIQAASAGMLVVVGVSTLWSSSQHFARKTVPVGSGGDRFLADSRGDDVQAAVDALAARPDPARSLVVLPEGVMVNYLSRTPSPVPFLNYMPPELVIFDEARILAALEESPPDLVVLAHKDTSEYGYRFFGHDYGSRIGGWVDSHYARTLLIGAEPFRDERFGLDVREHRLAPSR